MADRACVAAIDAAADDDAADVAADNAGSAIVSVAFTIGARIVGVVGRVVVRADTTREAKLSRAVRSCERDGGRVAARASRVDAARRDGARDTLRAVRYTGQSARCAGIEEAMVDSSRRARGGRWDRRGDRDRHEWIVDGDRRGRERRFGFELGRGFWFELGHEL